MNVSLIHLFIVLGELFVSWHLCFTSVFY